MHNHKRPLTHHPRPPTDPSSPSALISPDLNARLQNIGSRIRRSVSQGYATHPFSPASIHTQGQGSISDVAIFRSSNDTLRAVYSQFTSSMPAPSDRKRVRMESPADERDEHHEGSNTAQDGAGMHSASVIATSDLACSRPMKPLRRTPRAFGQTKSLPAAVFGSSSADNGQVHTPPDDAGSQMEEDWSADAFAEDSLKIQTLG
ncbi:hypothetical protein BC827DRAFT_1264957 [Russula dissimulans]|nr:hypothetical protein BC827DRAFT_1264957 [Russula dissimulans]